uniref:PR domain containing 2, with ZNF domain a n=1 Tax=Iconisemion striatum TaxID=60296 RepID=A0A1A7W8W9_9TELE
MDKSSHSYLSELGEDLLKEPEMSYNHTDHEYPKQDLERDSFLCQHCQRHFTSSQGLERHMHVHTYANEAHVCKSSTLGLMQVKQETTKPVDEDNSVVHVHTSSFICTNSSTFTVEDPTVQHHTTIDTNKQQHGWTVQENQLEISYEENAKPVQEEVPQSSQSESSKHQTQHTEEMVPTFGLQNEGERAQQYILDVPGNISENLSFYIDGKLVSASTISNCEVTEVQSGTSTLVGLDALIVDPAQFSQLLNTESEIPGQQHAKRRTTTPPLLPQIKPELESEVVASSSSSLLSSLLENLFPQKAESAVIQKEGTVLLSPKLKQLLEKQEDPKPTLALVTDGQKPSSPVSLSVLPSGMGKFRRRTSSPTGLPQQNTTANEETAEHDLEDFSAGSARLVESQHSPMVSEGDDTTLSTSVTEVKAVLSESWPPVTGGNSCNQKPLDLSNTLKRNEDVASGDAVLDLSLQRKSPSESESIFNFVSQAVMKGRPNMCMVNDALVKVGEQKLHLGNAMTPLLTDFTLVTGSDVMGPLEHVAEGLVYGLAMPPSSLTPSATSLTPVALDPASPCTIAFASPVAHTILPTAPSVITVLAPQSISNPSNQPIQVLAPNLSHEPLVICTDNDLNSSECCLTTSFAATNPANIVTFSQPLDPSLNLPSHVFLTDQIAISPPVVESNPVTQVPFTPTLSDSLLNIANNTVLIECTIALEAPGSVPAAVTLQENTVEPSAPTQMVVSHTKQQQIVSMPNSQTVDPTILMSSISESVTLSTNTAAISDSSGVNESTSDPEPVDGVEPPIKKDEEILPIASPLHIEKVDEKSSDTENDAQQQTFTKNFICNVCDKLFHSMKQLGHHVADHADEWPYKCEFCVLLFGKPSDLLNHRSSLHGVGKTYVCSLCTKEFVYLCNLKQHQEELHPGQQCSHTEEEKGKLRPQNYNSTKASPDPLVPKSPEEPKKVLKKEQCDVEVAADELFTIKIMASDRVKMKGPDVRLGINQHYPSFKPPPFPYHNRSPAGSLASATNFTTHNIPQTFSTAIRCTKCGKSFDNMPELHKHILACANASDKRRYTPRKNPIPLRHFAKSQNGVLSTTNSANGLNRVSQANGSKPSQESPVKLKILNKRKKKLVQRVMPQRNKSVPSSNKVSPTQVDEPREIFVCPHCSREFTMRRSRTKHMAVCPRKSQEIKKRKEGGISVTKENDEHLQTVKEKQQLSPQHNTRLQKSGSAKRRAILPVQTVFSSKRSKIIIKESTQVKQEALSFSEVPIRTFNPSMRQYSRVHHSIKGVPIKITIVKPRQSAPQKEESPPTQSREEPTGTVAIRTEQNVSA